MYNAETQQLYLAVLLTKPELYTKMKSVHKPEFYNPLVKKAATFIEDYYNEFSSLPDNLLIKTKTGVDIPRIPEVDHAAESWFIKEYPKFCLHKSLELAVTQASDELENENYDVVEQLIQQAYEVRLGFDYGLNFAEDPKQTLQNILDRSGNISTGFDSLDHVVGKFNAGDLVIYTGPSGGGKSLFLQNHSVYHAMDNKEVLQITLELHPELVARRMYSMLLDKSTKDLYADMNNVAAEIVLKLKKAKAGNVQIKYMPSGSSTADIKNLVKMYMNDTGKKVDILIIDYLDLVSPVAKVSVGDTFNKDKHVSEELRNIGQELGPVVITASQINRGGNGLDELDHTHIAGGISKINTADLVIGIITNNAMREKGMYEIQIMKARNSQGTGRKIPLLINTNTMKIFDDPDFLASINSYMKMSTAQANQSRHDSEVSKTINELQNALNKDSTDYTEVDPETCEPVEDQQNDDRFSQIQALINRNSKG